MIYCYHCGTQIEDETNFCPACGAKLSDTDTERPRQSTANQAEAQVSSDVITDDTKILGNSFEKKLFFGLSWIFNCFNTLSFIALILNIIVLCADKDKLTKEEKRLAASMPVMAVLSIIFAVVFGILTAITVLLCYLIIGILFLPVLVLAFLAYIVIYYVFSIIAAVKAFKGEVYHIPLVYQITTWFVQ